MNFIDRSAESIAKSIRRNHSDAGSEIALKYASSLLINTLVALTVALLISIMTGHVHQCLIAMVAFFPVRSVSGGMHMSSSLSCCMMSVLIFTIASFTDFNYSNIFIVIDLFSILILFITVPNNIQNVSSIDVKYYPLLKLIALLIVISNFFIQSSILTASFIMTAFLTTPIAYKVRDLIEGR